MTGKFIAQAEGHPRLVAWTRVLGLIICAMVAIDGAGWLALVSRGCLVALAPGVADDLASLYRARSITGQIGSLLRRTKGRP